MIFKNIDVNDGDIVYLCEYIPKSRCDEIDYRSKNLVLAYKNKDEYAIDIITDYIKENVSCDFSIIVIPSSKIDNKNISASHIVAGNLQDEEKNIIDASECLIRKYDIEPAHKMHGIRTPDRLFDSTEIINQQKISGRDILVIDDIVTSGSSFEAARMRLKQAGARNIINFAVGKTIDNNNLKYLFIIHSDFFYNIDDNVIKDFFVEISKIDAIYYIITKNTDENKAFSIIANNINFYLLNDGEKNCKDYINAYLKIKQQQMIFEPCITVFVSDKTQASAAKKCGITSVCINKHHDIKADVIFTDFNEINENFNKVVINAKYVIEKLWKNF